MGFFALLERKTSDLKLTTAVVLVLSLVLPFAMYLTSKWHREAILYADELKHESAVAAASHQITDHMKNWTEAKKRLPLSPNAGQAKSAETLMNVNIENQHMSRAEVDQVVEGLSRNTDGVFVPDAFLVRAIKSGEGIFTRNASEDMPGALALTIKGEFVAKDIQ